MSSEPICFSCLPVAGALLSKCPQIVKEEKYKTKEKTNADMGRHAIAQMAKDLLHVGKINISIKEHVFFCLSSPNSQD